MAVRVGIDLVSVESVEESVRRHADRYLHRIYTEREIRDCTTPTGVESERLAARFAAKEAAMKCLRPGDEGIPWRSIEVRRDPSGWVGLELSGTAAGLAAQAGVTDLAVSLTHERGLASAVVVAEMSNSNR
ncbi:MAG: holo-[acyl-carrier protein] synthase [Actinomycetota bacterium]|jgi:holo-[acyl-carrier protein] synthase|nr:holo-[acyl-carrier protein] synthase [Actinomycetota bacterium]MDX6659353.1 holo-[acyl-carrier protein] synthase [Solirubrobacteraceae bacterium]